MKVISQLDKLMLAKIVRMSNLTEVHPIISHLASRYLFFVEFVFFSPLIEGKNKDKYVRYFQRTKPM